MANECKITKIGFQCPKCGKTHYFDLQREELEKALGEGWLPSETQGILNRPPCGLFNLEISLSKVIPLIHIKMVN